MNFRSDATGEQRRIAEAYPKALRLFWRHDFSAARTELEKIADIDPPSRALLDRMAADGATAL